MGWFKNPFLARERKLGVKRKSLETKFILLDREQAVRQTVENLVTEWEEFRYKYIDGGILNLDGTTYGELLPSGFAVQQVNYAYTVVPGKDPRFDGGVALNELPLSELSALLTRYKRFLTKYVDNTEMKQAVSSYQEIASALTNYDTFKAEEAMRNVDNFNVYLAQVAAYNRIVEQNISIAEAILYGDKLTRVQEATEMRYDDNDDGGRHSTIRYKTNSKSSRKNTRGKKSKGKKSRGKKSRRK